MPQLEDFFLHRDRQRNRQSTAAFEVVVVDESTVAEGLDHVALGLVDVAFALALRDCREQLDLAGLGLSLSAGEAPDEDGKQRHAIRLALTTFTYSKKIASTAASSIVLPSVSRP